MQISFEGKGSFFPIWSHTTNELFFTTREEPNSRGRHVYFTTYEIDDDGEFSPGTPVKWEDGTVYQGGNSYDLHPDGTKLLVRKLADVEGEENQSLDQVVLFQHFDEHLLKEAPTGKK